MTSRQEKRRKQVHAMRANFALEGIYPDADDLTLQDAYIMGHVSISDMLEHARAFAACHSQGAASSREPYQRNFARILGITKNC